MRVLAIGDQHLPFEHKDYLDFCKQTKKKYKCNSIVMVGDVVDSHAISFHEHDPDGMSSGLELKEARLRLRQWVKAFPKVKICLGNHDVLPYRQAKSNGLSSEYIKDLNTILGLPSSWKFSFNHLIDNVMYTHGTGYSGKYPHVQAATDEGRSVVIGHCHSVLGIEYLMNSTSRKFGLSTGCGIDRKKYGFAYGKDFRRKPALGCGVIINGETAFVEAMKL